MSKNGIFDYTRYYTGVENHQAGYVEQNVKK